ncbi:DUF3261 domain-containing protein [Arenimonas caeni]|uniref:DUF3261 domain-containing protein n=2 Tax=Arenimonas caeni TaxID=2058085 RepID=A0A2P6MB74_9GAMM|nr:DUF3261 domain-containing protein [Arenimonas caeni]
MQRLMPLLLCALLAGCAGTPVRTTAPAADLPMLRLAPSALPGGMASQQRLVFDQGGRRDSIDAMVEVDTAGVRVVLHQQGQVLLRLDWDGDSLHEQRSAGLPDTLAGERVLTDLQLVHWPAAAIAAALPAGWRLASRQGHRELLQGGARVVAIDYPRDGEALLHNERVGYRLSIHSMAVQP